MVLWALFLVLGFAFIFSGLHAGLEPHPDSFGTTLYFSAGRMLAFPVAGIEATGIATRALTGVEAASGFGLFALVISLLFSLQPRQRGLGQLLRGCDGRRHPRPQHR